MFQHTRIFVGKQSLEAFVLRLANKNLIVMRGRRGYVMCGYLNMSVANKFGDVAVKVTGVASIKDTLKARVAACSRAAYKLGIRPDQPVRKILPLLV